MKTKTLKHIGYVITGESVLNIWGGGTGTIPMDENILPNGKLTHKNLLYCVNDGGFGCESIKSATVDIYDLYESGFREYNRTIEIDSSIHSVDFNRWDLLNKNHKQAIK